MFYVYLLQSTQEVNWTYVGSSGDLRTRFKQHNDGRVISTQARRPYTLVYYEAYADKTDARKREMELKNNWSEKEKLLRRIKNSRK